MYLRLKNAMEELFGQQTAFVLALRQGFSAALLQLSILSAMHVSPTKFLGHIWFQVCAFAGKCTLSVTVSKTLVLNFFTTVLSSEW